MKWLFSLLVAAVLAALLFSLWSVNTERAPALVPAPLAGELAAVAAPPESEAVESNRAPAPAPEPVIEPTAETPPVEAPAKLRERTESWQAIQKMLEDQELLDACARPKEIETEKLMTLVAKAERAIQGEVAEVVQARTEAGLFERIPGYVEGDHIKYPKDSPWLHRSFVGTGTGDAGWVVLERVDHPELYDLTDRTILLQAELKARERARRQR